MIEKDFIMRLLLDFWDKLTILLSKKRYDPADFLAVESIYQDVFHESRDFLFKEDIKEILEKIEKDCYYERLKLLALTFQLEAQMSMDMKEKDFLLEKSLSLFIYISQNNSAYDLETESKIRNLKRVIEKNKLMI